MSTSVVWKLPFFLRAIGYLPPMARYSKRERGKERGKSWLAGTAANAMGCSTIPRTYYSYYYFHLLQWFNFISSIMRLTDYPAPQHRDTGFKQPRALIPQREQGRVRGKEGRSERMGEKGTCVCVEEVAKKRDNKDSGSGWKWMWMEKHWRTLWKPHTGVWKIRSLTNRQTQLLRLSTMQFHLLCTCFAATTVHINKGPVLRGCL